MIITQHVEKYCPHKKALIVKREHDQKWEGVPKNLVTQVAAKLNEPCTTKKVMYLHMLSRNIFHNTMIAQLLEISVGTVSGIISRNQIEYLQKTSK